jgi:hypothetical protein
VSIYSPGGEHTLCVSVFTRTAHVIHHLVLPSFLDGRTNTTSDNVERLIPRDTLPVAFSSLSNALKRIENPIRIRDLVEGCRPFSAIASA